MFLTFITLMIIVSISGYLAYYKARRFKQHPQSRPCYYGLMAGFVSLTSAVIMLVGQRILCFLHKGFCMKGTAAMFLILGAATMGGSLAWILMVAHFHAREWVEKITRGTLAFAALISIFITLSIIITLLFETLRFFKYIPLMDFLFGLHWNPQTSYTSETQIVDHGLYGAVPLFTGTFLIMGIALVIAVPIGLFIAIYMREYARDRTRYLIKPMIEILAGIPTIVYGFFALVAVMPFLQSLGDWIGVDISSQSALGVGIVMGLMIIPYISSLSDEALGTVPQSLRDNSLALGATPSETIKRVVIPAAAPGIITAILLAISRAVGETMLVVMAAGLTPHLTLNPAEAVTTVTVQIVSLLTGDQEFDSPKTLSAFALGMTLFLLTLLLNMISGRVIQRYRDKYDV